LLFFFFSSRRRHTRLQGDWSSDVCSSDLAMRLAGFGIRAPKNALLGYDVAGRVEAVGARVTEFRPGQEVFRTCRVSFAEYAVARSEERRVGKECRSRGSPQRSVTWWWRPR